MITVIEVDKEYEQDKFNIPVHTTFIGDGYYEVNYKLESVTFVFAPINYLQVAHNSVMFMLFNRHAFKPSIN